MIAIIDYGMGNLRSVQKALEYIGYEACVTSEHSVIEKADKIILPGVGAFRDAIQTLRQKKLDGVIHDAVNQGKPFLGICLGMQLIFERSFENGVHEGLGLLKGDIVRIEGDVKIPHIGWNDLLIRQDSPLLSGLPSNPYVYFVHSYYARADEKDVAAVTEYGQPLTAVVAKDNVFACQFHPEKSGNVGLQILKNFGGFSHANISSH